MAKGAKRKTKWVSLSLAGANTTTSVATGSDSEHPHHQQQYGGGHRQKTLNGATKTTKHSNSNASSITTTTTTTTSHRVLGSGTDSAEEHHSNEPLDHSGNRTDTSGSSSSGDCATGSSTMDRRPSGAYHRRRQPPSTYQTGRSGWNGGVTGGATNGGRGSYNNGGSRSGSYYSSYYGSGRRSYYDNHTRRPANATGTNHNTTSGEGGGGTTINDDEYTRITTPRQDVLFKKGYLSRPKPATATATAASTSNENTASSSIAGTTSEGSDGGNGGGSNSISTTESITSEYGGSYAADAYPYPILPCGYFTENGVFVMNGFAMDNNGYSYFNGGQTYIYPPNFNNCQQQQPQPSPGGGEPTDTTIPYPTNDANQPLPTILPTDTDVQTEGAIAMGGYRSIDAAGGDGPSSAAAAASFLQLCEVGGQAVLPDGMPEAAELEQAGARVTPADPAGDGTVEGEVAVEGGEGAAQGEVVVAAPLDVPDYENGFYQFTDGYDFAQFLSSMYYPNWMMEQYPLYDDAGAPLYFGGEYGMPNGDVYPHQTSFKRRKKRFRTFDEIPGEGGTSYELTDLTSSTVHEVNPVAPLDVAPVGVTPAGDEAASNEHQLHADVRVFQPSPAVTSAAGEVPQLDRNQPPRVTKKPPPAAKKPPPATVAPPAGEGNGTTTTTTSSAVAGRPSAKSHRIARKDLIESTLAFAEQNIDLTRSKALAVAAPNGELECWTTVDRNGRKKRLEPQASRIAPSPPLAKEKKAAVPNEAEQGVNVPEKKAPPPVEVLSTPQPVVPLDTVSTSSASSSTLDGPSTDTSTKKDSTKAKKKTKSSKRQLHRKAAGGFHKQHKQEGFQLIEPEFPSAASPAVVHHRGRSCDNADTLEQLVDESAEEKEEEEEEQEQEGQVEQQIELESVGTVEQAEIVSLCELIPEQRAGGGQVDLAEEQITSVELNCDRANGDDDVAAGPAPLTEVIEEREDDVAQTLVLTTLPPSAVAEEQIVVNETETEREQQPELQPETPHQGPVEELGCVERAPESGMMEQDVVDGVKETLHSVACTMHSVEQSSAPVVPVDRTDVESACQSVLCESNEVKEEAIVEPVPEDDCPDEALQPMEMCTTERNVLTCAAKQLALGDRPSLQLPEPSDNDVEVQEGDEEGGDVGNGCATGSDEDEGSRGKRCSVSSVGYGENIDSGLQSPAPCGGVASPEVTLMVSSIESDQPHPETTNLSQIVGKWLLRKLEVHETEELFVLPSDPRLLERLERFQLLVRRERPQRGFFASDSEDDGEDLEGGSDDEEEEEDFDSDYMSDGQGRLDRTAAGDTNPSSPLNSASDAPLSPPSSPSDADGSQLPCAKANEAAAVVAAPPNTHVLSSSDSRSINSPTSALRGAAAASSSAGAESKRCTIM